MVQIKHLQHRKKCQIFSSQDVQNGRGRRDKILGAPSSWPENYC